MSESTILEVPKSTANYRLHAAIFTPACTDATWLQLWLSTSAWNHTEALSKVGFSTYLYLHLCLENFHFSTSYGTVTWAVRELKES